MSRILRRPMFRGGRVNSYGTGIASGLADGGRVGFFNGGTSGGEFLRKARIRGPRDLGIIQTLPDRINIGTPRKPKFIDTPLYEEFPEVDKFPLFADASTIMTDATITESPDKETEEIKETADVETGLELTNTNPNEFKEKPIETPTIKETEDNEVTMTDLERALGLDDARKEYVGDALAAASKAFFEGRGFEAIADAAKVKSKAPDIKRLAGLEEFKAEKAKELYKTKLDAQLKQKLGTRGALQKDIEYLSGLSGADRIAALGKLGYKAPSLSAAIKELKVTGQSPDPSTIVSLAELYIGPDFKGVVSATEDMAGKSEGTYITEDGAALIIVDEKGNTRVQQL